MKLLILGASKAQLIGISMAKAMGHEVVTCDYIKTAIGHQLSDVQSYASTFDVESVLKVARKESIDGIMTLGTDQPVYSAAVVAEAMNLPQVLTVDVALSVTNKKVMKKKFMDQAIPTVTYILYEKGLNDEALNDFEYPVVVKPIDSQGQRGIFLLKTPEAVRAHYEAVVAYSRCKEILVESYYKHNEITVSGWVQDQVVYVLSITDRVTFDSTDQLGICLSHELPSKYLGSHGQEVVELTRRITQAFDIQNGPIYYQFLLGDKGLKVNEIACRIGGAHEATFLPIVTGFDCCKAAINASLGKSVDLAPLKNYKVLKPEIFISVQLFFCGPCQVASIPLVDKIMALDGVVDYAMMLKSGDKVDTIANATSRAGYAVIRAMSKKELEERLIEFYKYVKIIGNDGLNHIIHRTLTE